MLSVNGVITVEETMNLKAWPRPKGTMLEFDVRSIDHKEDSQQRVHRYRAVLWVPTDDVDRWTKEIQPGNTYLVEHGSWKMKERQNLKHPIPELKLDRLALRRLGNAKDLPGLEISAEGGSPKAGPAQEPKQLSPNLEAWKK